MSNKSWSKLPSRGGNGCRGMEEPKCHFGICYSTFNRLRTLTCHPSFGWASEVKGERQHAVGHCFCLPRCSPGVTRTNQHPAKCSVIGRVHSVLAWLHAWLDCRIPFEEKGSPSYCVSVCVYLAQCVCVCVYVYLYGAGVRCHTGFQERRGTSVFFIRVIFFFFFLPSTHWSRWYLKINQILE